MGAAVELTEEQLEAVVEAYEELGTYTGVAKELGLPITRVKAILQDRLDIKPTGSKRKMAVYLPPDTELPQEPQEKAVMDYTIVAKNLLKELMEDNGLLQAKL